MQKKNLLLLSAASVLFMTSCSKLGPLSADNFTVIPNPLETTAGEVPATVNGTFPEKYMKKKAVVTVTPELHYGNGQVAKGQSATFQGEKVMGNDQTISYKVGGRYTMKTNFKYVPEMQKSEMYLAFDARIGKKQFNVPSVKVADGVIATSELYKNTVTSETGCIAPDAFQRVNAQKQEANIKFLINQANIRKSELKNNSVKEFVEMLKKINADREGLNIQNVEIQAYASPEGGVKFNDKLAGQRKNQSEKYVKNTLKNTKVDAALDAHYTAQDWEGFQELVQNSDIEDKDLILRVLSMYSDPAVRESEIKNMSSIYTDLKSDVLPELRRARFIANVEFKNYTADELLEMIDNNSDVLDEPALLHSATLVKDLDTKVKLYNQAIKKFDSDAARFNLAVTLMDSGDLKGAEKAFAEVENRDSDYQNALGVLALRNGDYNSAAAYFKKAGTAVAKANRGLLDILSGDYESAAENLEDAPGCCRNTVVAYILNNQLDKASAAITCDDAYANYLRAIIAARQGKKDEVKAALDKVAKLDKKLAARAAKDVEFAEYYK